MGKAGRHTTNVEGRAGRRRQEHGVRRVSGTVPAAFFSAVHGGFGAPAVHRPTGRVLGHERPSNDHPEAQLFHKRKRFHRRLAQFYVRGSSVGTGHSERGEPDVDRGVRQVGVDR